MADIASLGLEVDSSKIREATLALRAMPEAASAAERAAAKWGLTTDAAAQSSDEFSKRVQKTIRDLDFQTQQLQRNTVEQERYAAVRKAGVSADSAAGQAVMASVTALQAQRAAHRSAGEAATLTATATRAAGASYGFLVDHLKGLAAAYISVEVARKAWEIGLKAGDLGDQAEQIGVNTDQLQAYRLAGAQVGIEAEQMDGAITKLARSMGSAADGNKEMIELFRKLKVNLLDARGELRPTADVLPEVARGLLAVQSSSQRTANEMTLFGKSGAVMATVLKVIAQGNDAVVQSARDQKALVSPEAIESWNRLSASMKVAEQRWSTLVAEFGADLALPVVEHLKGLLEGTRKELEGIQSIWKWIVANMDAAKRADVRAAATPAQNDLQNLQDRLAALRQNPTQFGFQASEKALTEQIAARQEAAKRIEALANQTVLQMDEGDARRGKLPIAAPPLGVTETGTRGVGSPVPKEAGESYRKLTAEAEKYIAVKNAETAGIGLNAEAAARLKHEQELLGKATEGNLVLGPQQIAQIKDLAAAMAAADGKFAAAKFIDDMNKHTSEFVANQDAEREALLLSTRSADELRFAQELLNKAKAEGVPIDEALRASIQASAAAMANAKAKTDTLREAVDFAKDVTKGFMSDINNGLRQGQSLWESFGNAAVNVLNKISDKLMEMAVNQIFDAAFGGKGGGGGGIANLLGLGGPSNGFGGLFGGASFGGTTFADAVAGGIMPVAKGGVFAHGNVVPFAHGGIVSRPTLFPMANGGTGLMGEAGDEGVLPLRRNSRGQLGVHASGMTAPVINIEVAADSDWVRATARDEAGNVVAASTPKIISTAVKKSGEQVVPITDNYHRERGGDYRAG